MLRQGLYRDFSPEQRNILRAKTFAGTHVIAALQSLLGPLAEFDGKVDQARSATRRTATKAAVGTLFVGVGLLATGAPESFFVLPTVGAALTIGASLRYLRLKRLDLSDNLRKVVMPLLTVLREELDPEDPVVVELDLRSPILPEKLLHEDSLQPTDVHTKIVVRHFKDPWMSGRSRLRDGARLDWTVVDHVTEEKKTKRNPRGKTKTKIRYKKRTTITVKLGLPKRVYFVSPSETVADGKLRFKSHETEKWKTVEVSTVLKTSSLDPIDPLKLIDLIATVYRRAMPVAIRSPV